MLKSGLNQLLKTLVRRFSTQTVNGVRNNVVYFSFRRLLRSRIASKLTLMCTTAGDLTTTMYSSVFTSTYK